MSAVALRTKALKALSLIAAVDADILAQPAVRAAFESRMSDPSPAVRDAAVDLVGKYVVERPELAVEYYPQIALRVSVSFADFVSHGMGVQLTI
jgi:cohesin loading factor subunit SCC2